MKDIKIKEYAGINTKRIEMYDIEWNLTLWYSYEEIIAFRFVDVKSGMEHFIVSENIWSTTTGRHINTIHINHKDRLQRDVFLTKLHSVLERIKLV